MLPGALPQQSRSLLQEPFAIEQAPEMVVQCRVTGLVAGRSMRHAVVGEEPLPPQHSSLTVQAAAAPVPVGLHGDGTR